MMAVTMMIMIGMRKNNYDIRAEVKRIKSKGVSIYWG